MFETRYQYKVLICQFYIMLKTIYSDNKINELPEIQPPYYKDVTMFGIKQLRSSLSPQKVKTSKKFFYSIRNKSIKKFEDQSSAQHELESLIRKQKIILMAQRTNMNDILLPGADIPVRQAEIMSFPTIDVKRVSEGDVRHNTLRKKYEKRGLIDLIDFRNDYQSNILKVKKGQYDTLPNTNVNWPQKQEIPVQKQQKKQDVTPKIIPKRASSEIERKNQQSPTIKVSQSYSPSKLSQAKSNIKLEQRVSIQKKFKKGFLSYESYGQQRWEKIKMGVLKEPSLKLQNSNKVLSAKVFYVYDVQSNQPIVAHNQQEQIQIASLTKIMTCYLSILICKKYEVDIKNYYYRVPDKIPETPGTSAELMAGDLLNVEDLLYGLMLPSGNDASICLAELMGKIIQRHKKKQQRFTYFQTFISHMNAFSKQLDLKQQWGNSSGLSFNPNFSTAQAITALAALAIKNELFKKIVTTKQIELDIKNDRYGLVTKKVWKNTNKLLEKGWQGVKTGTTETAGHCLISKKQNLILSVFDCQTMSKRFTDSIRLYEHITKIRQNS